MAGTFELNMKILPGVGPWISEQWKSASKALALRALEGKLAKIITTANGHRKNNVPKHSDLYRVLYLKAEEQIDMFCTEHSVDPFMVYAQMPALNELKDWGSPAPAGTPKVTKTFGGLLGWIVFFILIGFLSGLSQRLFHFGWTVAHYHAR